MLNTTVQGIAISKSRRPVRNHVSHNTMVDKISRISPGFERNSSRGCSTILLRAWATVALVGGSGFSLETWGSAVAIGWLRVTYLGGI
jgi:hypothetical protein